MQGMQEFWVVMMIALGVMYVVAFTRRGSTRMAMPGRKQDIYSNASPAEVFAAIKRVPPPFKIDDLDEQNKIICISSPVSFGSWGFFYPVFIAPAANGGSQITIGCTSKIFQLGPLVTRAHNKCVEAVERTLTVATARVV